MRNSEKRENYRAAYLDYLASGMTKPEFHRKRFGLYCKSGKCLSLHSMYRIFREAELSEESKARELGPNLRMVTLTKADIEVIDETLKKPLSATERTLCICLVSGDRIEFQSSDPEAFVLKLLRGRRV